jgi:hypothetical protein
VEEIPRPIVLRSAVSDGFNYGEFWLACPLCTAEWVGYADDLCGWCYAWKERMERDRRKELLWPPWAANGNSPRYDELSDDVAREVWRKTRGQKVDADSLIQWAKELSAAVSEHLITPAEAEAAITRLGEHEDE